MAAANRSDFSGLNVTIRLQPGCNEKPAVYLGQ